MGQGASEGLYDLVIDDLYGEQAGEPVRCAPLDREWFDDITKLLRPGGMLVLNLIEPDKVPYLPPMQDAGFGCTFSTAKSFGWQLRKPSGGDS